MNVSHLYPIMLITTVLSANLNAMELIHPPKNEKSKPSQYVTAEELLQQLTDNNKIELSQTAKKNIAQYCIQRITGALDDTKEKIEINCKLSSECMYDFLKNDSMSLILFSVCKKMSQDKSLNNSPLHLSLQKASQNIDTCPEARLFYYFPKAIENNCYVTFAQLSSAQNQSITTKEPSENFDPSPENVVNKGLLIESVQLAENILSLLQKDVDIAKFFLLSKKGQLNSEQKTIVMQDLDQITFVDIINDIFKNACAMMLTDRESDEIL